MTVKVATISAAASTAVGTQDFTSPGFGDVKAALFVATHDSGYGFPLNNFSFMMGAVDGTNQRVSSMTAQHNRNPSVAACRGHNDRCISIRFGSGVISGEAEFTSFITDGVRVNWLNGANAPSSITVVLFGGTSVDARVFDVTTSGTIGTPVSETGYGFQPDLLIGFSHHAAFNGVEQTDGRLTLSSSARNGASSATTTFVKNGVSPSVGATYNDGRRFITNINETSSLSSAEIASFDLDGFTINHEAGTDPITIGGLALGFNGQARGWSGRYSVPPSVQVRTHAATMLKPQYVGIVMSDALGDEILHTGVNAASIGFGSADGTNQHSLSSCFETGQTTTDAQSLADIGAVIMPLPDGSTGTIGTLTGFDNLGPTIDYTTVAAGGSRKFTGFAISTTFEQVFPDNVVVGTAVNGPDVQLGAIQVNPGSASIGSGASDLEPSHAGLQTNPEAGGTLTLTPQSPGVQSSLTVNPETVALGETAADAVPQSATNANTGDVNLDLTAQDTNVTLGALQVNPIGVALNADGEPVNIGHSGLGAQPSPVQVQTVAGSPGVQTTLVVNPDSVSVGESASDALLNTANTANPADTNLDLLPQSPGVSIGTLQVNPVGAVLTADGEPVNVGDTGLGAQPSLVQIQTAVNSPGVQTVLQVNPDGVSVSEGASAAILDSATTANPGDTNLDLLPENPSVTLGSLQVNPLGATLSAEADPVNIGDTGLGVQASDLNVDLQPNSPGVQTVLSVNPESATLTLTPLDAVINVGVQVNPDSVEINETVDPTSVSLGQLQVNPDSAVARFEGEPLNIGDAGLGVQGRDVTLNLTPQSPGVQTLLQVNPDSVTLTLQPLDAVITVGVQVNPDTTVINETVNPTTITVGDLQVNPDGAGVDSNAQPMQIGDAGLGVLGDTSPLTLTPQSPGVQTVLTVNPDSVILTLTPSDAVTQSGTNVNPESVVLTETTEDPTITVGNLVVNPLGGVINADPEPLQIGDAGLGVQARDVTLNLLPQSPGVETRLEVNPDSVTVSLQASDAVFDVAIQANPDSVTLTLLPQDTQVNLGALSVNPDSATASFEGEPLNIGDAGLGTQPRDVQLNLSAEGPAVQTSLVVNPESVSIDLNPAGAVLDTSSQVNPGSVAINEAAPGPDVTQSSIVVTVATTGFTLNPEGLEIQDGSLATRPDSQVVINLESNGPEVSYGTLQVSPDSVSVGATANSLDNGSPALGISGDDTQLNLTVDSPSVSTTLGVNPETAQLTSQSGPVQGGSTSNVDSGSDALTLTAESPQIGLNLVVNPESAPLGITASPLDIVQGAGTQHIRTEPAVVDTEPQSPEATLGILQVNPDSAVIGSEANQADTKFQIGVIPSSATVGLEAENVSVLLGQLEVVVDPAIVNISPEDARPNNLGLIEIFPDSVEITFDPRRPRVVNGNDGGWIDLNAVSETIKAHLEADTDLITARAAITGGRGIGLTANRIYPPMLDNNNNFVVDGAQTPFFSVTPAQGEFLSHEQFGARTNEVIRRSISCILSFNRPTYSQDAILKELFILTVRSLFAKDLEEKLQRLGVKMIRPGARVSLDGLAVGTNLPAFLLDVEAVVDGARFNSVAL